MEESTEGYDIIYLDFGKAFDRIGGTVGTGTILKNRLNEKFRALRIRRRVCRRTEYGYWKGDWDLGDGVKRR